MEDLKLEKVGELVASDYRKAGVFKKYGIDFCCGGGISIQAACAKHDINEEDLINELNELDKVSNSEHNFKDWKLDFLIDYILNTHHVYVKENIELILGFSQKVARVHGENHPELVTINHLFLKLARELEQHMHKEEHVLFPYVKQLVANKIEAVPFGTIKNPISVMEHEHDEAGAILKQISELSSNYSPPADACSTYKVLFAKLEEFENDLHKHVHLENNILFPKALKLEEHLRA